MEKYLPKTYAEDLTNLYLLVYNRNFEESEKALLSLISKILNNTKSEKEILEGLLIANIVYNEFNESYLQWVKKFGENQNKEIIRRANYPLFQYLYSGQGESYQAFLSY